MDVQGQTKTTAKNVVKMLTSKELGITEFTQASLRSFATSVRVLLSNWRQATSSAKGRSDVSYSNKKPWKQKGTGRARAGSARSPLWRGGGVTFGPQPGKRPRFINKKQRRNVLLTLLDQLAEQKNVVSTNWHIIGEKPSTKQAHALLKNIGLDKTKVLVLINQNDAITAASFSNLPMVHVLFIDSIDSFCLSSCKKILIFDHDVEQFKEMVGRWS
jgi:large subunit ribosomal protein L4